MIRQSALLAILAFSGLNFSACGGKCYDLAEKLCDCKASTTEREACKKKLDVTKTHRRLKLAEDEAVCAAALKTCSCEAYSRLEYEKCGLTPIYKPLKPKEDTK